MQRACGRNDCCEMKPTGTFRTVTEVSSAPPGERQAAEHAPDPVTVGRGSHWSVAFSWFPGVAHVPSSGTGTVAPVDEELKTADDSAGVVEDAVGAAANRTVRVQLFEG